MSAFVLPFDSSDATLAAIGGKGANLSRMTRAGFPVPPGFFITTFAYHAFVQANDLQTQIMELASDKTKTVEDASTAIRQLFERGYIPPEIAAAIQQTYAGLMETTDDSSPVAVRSSATAEDLPDASFAGQQESYLNVRGEAALMEALKRCWSSLWTARALLVEGEIERAGIWFAEQVVPFEPFFKRLAAHGLVPIVEEQIHPMGA